MVGGDSQAERLQSAYITEDEVKNVVKYLKNAFKDDIRDTIELSGTVGGGGEKPCLAVISVTRKTMNCTRKLAPA